MKKFRVMTAAVLIGGLLAPTAAFADDAAILARLAALEQEIAVLKRQLEVKKEEDDKKKPETPVITASAKDGFTIKSPDDSFKLRVRGLLQTDGRFFADSKNSGTTDSFLVRRARPIFEGTVAKNFGYYLMPDFGQGSAVLTDGYVDYIHSPELKLRAGKFKEPFQLERLQSDSVANFMETGLPANLTPNRDVGVQLSGDLWNESVSYAIGAFNGSADNASSTHNDLDTNNDKDVAGRVFVHPFKNTDYDVVRGLGLGVAGTYGQQENALTPTFRSPGQTSVFTFHSNTTADGPHGRFSPQGYWYWNQFGVLAEYVVSNQQLERGTVAEKFTNDAWQVSASYVLTGEDASYKGVKPRKPFDLSQGQWGAFEVVARYGELDLDDDIFRLNFANEATSISGESAVGIGLNWYLNSNVRLMLDYERTNFDGGATAEGLIEDRPTEDAIFTRFQLAY